eukprot:COSAG06_NODE_6771_length_2788_cov_60.304202_3_plen_148_part_00
MGEGEWPVRCFCESKFAEPPDSNPLPDIGSASSRLDDPDTAVTREEFEFALRTLAETKAAGWDDVVAEQYKYCAAAADELFRERHKAQLRGRPAAGPARSVLPRRGRRMDHASWHAAADSRQAAVIRRRHRTDLIDPQRGVRARDEH